VRAAGWFEVPRTVWQRGGWPPLAPRPLVEKQSIGWRGGTTPPRSRQTGREPLDSSGFLLRLARVRLLSVTRLAKRSSAKSGAFAPVSLQDLLHYYAPGCPSAPHPVLSPSAFWPRRTPVPTPTAGPRHDWFPSSVQEPALRSCPLYAGHRLARNENTPPD